MNQPQPLVSVIIPVHNGEAYLAEAIASIRDQGWPSLEIIVVDDGSTDGTAELAENLGEGIRYVRQANQGPAAARNRGLDMARGDIIAFLDADDLWPADKLRIQVRALEDDPSRDVVLGKTRFMRLCDSADGRKEFREYLRPGIFLNLGSALYRKIVFQTVGRFDPGLRTSEDVDWFIRARQGGASIFLIEPVTLIYRTHQTNMTHGKSPGELGFLKVLKNSLDRRRG